MFSLSERQQNAIRQGLNPAQACASWLEPVHLRAHALGIPYERYQATSPEAAQALIKTVGLERRTQTLTLKKQGLQATPPVVNLPQLASAIGTHTPATHHHILINTMPQTHSLIA